MRKTKKALATLAIMGMVATMAPLNAFAATGVTTDRLSGTDRFGTANTVADKFVSATTAILAPSADANLVDALAAAPLAGKTDPILLTDNNTLTASTQAELTKLGVKNVYVVGAIDQAVVAQVTAMGITATPLKGADRMATAGLISAKLTSPAGSFVVGYNALADALSVASYAAAHNYSIVVANTDGTIPSTETVASSNVYVIGGPTLVQDVAGATRIFGADRFATNKLVLAKLGYTYDKAYVANGTDEHLVDSLVASSLAALSGAPIVLTDTLGSGSAASAAINAQLGATAQVIALGGTTVVPDSVRDQVAYGQSTSVASVSAINANMAVGGQTGFQFMNGAGNVVAVTGATLTLSDDSFGSISPSGIFTAAKVGTVTVTATVNGTQYTTKVNVFGAPASVTLSTPTLLVANGVSTESVTATVVDANGNPVNSYNGVAVFNFVNSSSVAVTPVGSQLVDPVSGNVVSGSSSATANIVNGVATIKLQATNVSGVTDKLKAMSITRTGSNSTTQVSGLNVASSSASVSTIAQIATSITLSAPTGLANNVATNATISAKLLDQDKKVMLGGSYPVTFTVSGPAVVVGGTSSTTYTGVFVGNNSQSNTTAQVTIQSQQGVAGSISVKADSTGLTSATASFNSVSAGTPTALTLTVNKASWVQGESAYNTVGSVSVQVVDANGTPVGDLAVGSSAPGNVTVNVKDSGANAATWLSVGTISGSTVSTIGHPDANGNITVTLPNSGAVKLAVWDQNTGALTGSADDYSVSVSSNANGYNLAAQATTLTENASTAAGLAKVAPKVSQNVLASNTAYDVKYQLTDINGNYVSQAGLTVNLYATSPGTHTATLNGQSNVTSGAPLQMVTNADGQVTVTIAPQAYVGDVWTVYAQVPAQAGIASAMPVSALPSNTITVVAANAASVGLQFNDTTASTTNVSSTIAGNFVTLDLTALDQYSNTVSASDTIEVVLPASLSGGATIPTLSAGTATMKPGTTWKQYAANTIRVPLASGVVTIGSSSSLVASQAGTASVTATDLTANSTVTGSGAIAISAQTASTAAVFFNGKVVSSSNPIAVSANSTVAVVVTPVDAQNNPGVATTTKTYNLSDGGNGGTFSLTQGGSAVTQATLPINTAGVTVYYKAASTLSNAPISISLAPVTAGLNGAVTTVGANTLTITTYGQQLNGTYYVKLDSSSLQGNVLPNTTAVNFVNGVGTITGTIQKSGAQTLTATVYSATSGVGQVAVTAPVSVTTVAGATTTLTFGAATGMAANVAATQNLAALLTTTDTYGNTTTGDTITWAITTDPGSATGVTVPAGTFTVTGTLSPVGAYVVTATDGTLTKTVTVTLA